MKHIFILNPSISYASPKISLSQLITHDQYIIYLFDIFITFLKQYNYLNDK